MKKILIIITFTVLYSCLVPGAPHGHGFNEANKKENIYLHVTCRQFDKIFDFISKKNIDSLKIIRFPFKYNRVLKKKTRKDLYIYSLDTRMFDRKMHKINKLDNHYSTSKI